LTIVGNSVGFIESGVEEAPCLTHYFSCGLAHTTAHAVDNAVFVATGNHLQMLCRLVVKHAFQDFFIVKDGVQILVPGINQIVTLFGGDEADRHEQVYNEDNSPKTLRKTHYSISLSTKKQPGCHCPGVNPNS
jgi:hypothetical protein